MSTYKFKSGKEVDEMKASYHVFLTMDTIRGMMLEVSRHPGLECVIQMPGVRIRGDFYFDMVADSGMKATYEYAMCEKDHLYIDHLSTRIAEYYDFPPERMTVSQVHKHPPGCDRFSQGDRPANLSLARQFGGVVNGLILVNPEFHIKFWYIDAEGNETPVPYSVDDAAVQKAMPKKRVTSLKQDLERREKKAVDARRGFHESSRVGKKSFLTVLSDFRKRSGDRKEDEKMNNSESMNIENALDAVRPYIVILPSEYKEEKYEGALHGYYIKETKTFNVVSDELTSSRRDTTIIGQAFASETADGKQLEGKHRIMVRWGEESSDARVMDDPGAEVTVEFYSLQKEIFSRNQGILESDQMKDKQACVLGCGSGGAFAALELAKAGIGSLILADDDRFAYHNICRHVCGIHDVGKFKVDALKERIADINPYCRVYTFRNKIQHVDPAALAEILWKKSILLCCADNRHAGYVCNEMSDRYHIPMIDAGCGPRASTGEIFYYRPDRGMSCYTCAYGEDRGVDYSNQAVRRAFYATEAELEKLHFQPGMSLDIEQTAIFETKLAVDLLMDGEKGYEPKLLPYINQCAIILNYKVDSEVNPYMKLFENTDNGERPLTWKTGPARKNPECSYCGAK